ncbi:hypothetical protein cand_005720 [Cryptosporidium andersoni]|uniref:Uncharacterized protein n=1 Tax=Cryptosporidium andersoni TaxID=117008 RepID=A0A1J4MPP3_9CRYT|nr:hypothetical protein cand_005720 [Cryptosporidium andersoni]
MHVSIPPPPLLQSSTRIARPIKESIACDVNRVSDVTIKASNVVHGNINGAAKLDEEFAYKSEGMVENPPNKLPEQYDQKTYILGKLQSNQLFNNSEQPNYTYSHMEIEMGGNNRSISSDFSTVSLPPTKLNMDKSNSKPFQNTEINTVFSTLKSEKYLHGNRSEDEANVNFDWSSVSGYNKYELPLNGSSSNEIQQIRNYETNTANLSRINKEQSNGFFVTTHNRFCEGKNSNIPLNDKSNYLFSEGVVNLEENRSTCHIHGNYIATNNLKEFGLNSGNIELSKSISLKNNHTASRLPPKLPTISTNIVPTPIDHTETDIRDTGNLELPNFSKGDHEIIPERGKSSTRPPTAPIFSSVDNSIHLNRKIILENIQDCKSQIYTKSELVDINEMSLKHDISQDLPSSFQGLSLKLTSSQLLPNNVSPFINKSNLDTDKLRPPSACVSVTRPPTAPNNSLGPHPKVEMLMNLMDRTVENKKREFEKLNRLKSALSELGDFNKRLLEENIRLKSANLNTDCEESIKSEVVNQKVLNTKLSIDNDIDNNSNREVELLQNELYKKDEVIRNLQNKLISKSSFDKFSADQMTSTYMKIFKKIEQKSSLFKESVDDINNLLSNIIGLAEDSVELLGNKMVENLNRLSSDIIHQIEFNYSALKVTLNHLSDRQQIILGSMTRIDNLEISDKRYSNINIEDNSSANFEGNRSPTYKFNFESNDECNNNVMEEASNILDYNSKANTSYSHSINGLFSHTNDDLSTTGNNKNLVDINLPDGNTYHLDQLPYSQSQFDSVSLENQKPPVETVYNNDSNTSWNYDQPYDLTQTISDIDYIYNYNVMQNISSSKATI